MRTETAGSSFRVHAGDAVRRGSTLPARCADFLKPKPAIECPGAAVRNQGFQRVASHPLHWRRTARDRPPVAVPRQSPEACGSTAMVVSIAPRDLLSVTAPVRRIALSCHHWTIKSRPDGACDRRSWPAAPTDMDRKSLDLERFARPASRSRRRPVARLTSATPT